MRRHEIAVAPSYFGETSALSGDKCHDPKLSENKFLPLPATLQFRSEMGIASIVAGGNYERLVIERAVSWASDPMDQGADSDFSPPPS